MQALWGYFCCAKQSISGLLTLGVWLVAASALAIEPAVPQAEAGSTAESASPTSWESVDTAEPSIEATQTADSALAQVTSVTQLSDVQPTDWAFQALQSLVERYGCIAGYPDGSYRGQRALTRFEFAAGLNACLDRVNELIAAGLADVATQADLETLQRLQEEFAAELTTLRGRVDALEARTAELEANQFSTTTKLVGETVFGLADLFGGETGEDNNTIFGSRTRLRFETSFMGEDQLLARLQWGNFEMFDSTATDRGNGATNEPRLSFDTDTNGNVELDILHYQLPIGDRVTTYILANGANAEYDFTNTISPFDSSGTGAISRFGRRNPAVYRTPGNAGLGINFELSDAVRLDLAYLAAEPSDPNDGAGLFNGEYSAFAQLTLTPNDRLSLGLTYVNAYYQGTIDSGTGSALADLNLGLPIITNAYGAQVNFAISEGLEIGGWAGYTFARVISTGDGEIFNFAGYLAFPDLGAEGNLGGLIVGMQPRLQEASSNLAAVLGADEDEDTGLHIEAFYRYQITDNIAITPGVVWLTAPNHDADNDDIVLGTIRTTFRF
jgi:hypothetical protein